MLKILNGRGATQIRLEEHGDKKNVNEYRADSVGLSGEASTIKEVIKSMVFTWVTNPTHGMRSFCLCDPEKCVSSKKFVPPRLKEPTRIEENDFTEMTHKTTCSTSTRSPKSRQSVGQGEPVSLSWSRKNSFDETKKSLVLFDMQIVDANLELGRFHPYFERGVRFEAFGRSDEKECGIIRTNSIECLC